MRVVVVGDQIASLFGRRLKELGDGKARRVLSTGLNKGGNQGRTLVKQSLKSQTGVKYNLINKAVTTVPSTPGTLSYSLVAHGSETNLNLFGAKQGKRGVSAAPWNKRRQFKKTFIVPAYGGRVFKRNQKERGPLDPLWGPNIAREMVKSPTIDKWQSVQGLVIKTVGHEIMRIIG